MLSRSVPFTKCGYKVLSPQTDLILTSSILRFDLDNFFAASGPAGLEFKGSLLSPLRAIMNIIGFSHMFVVPVLYAAIYQFRNRFDSAQTGNLSGWIWVAVNENG